MKKTLLSILSIAAFSAASYGQCIPDAAFAGQPLGFYPDAATFTANSSATAGVDYSEVLTLTMIVDTTVTVSPFPTTDAKLDAFQLIDIVGAPTGFNFSEGGTSFSSSIPGWENTYGTLGDASTLTAAQGCLSITADAVDVTAAAPSSGFTDYPLTITMDARVADPAIVAGSWIVADLGQPAVAFTDHVIRVNAATTVGILYQKDETGVSVFPNPSNGVFQLVFNNLEQNASASVYDLQGREVWNDVLANSSGMESIDLSGFTAGVYTLSVRTDSKSISKKLILQ